MSLGSDSECQAKEEDEREEGREERREEKEGVIFVYSFEPLPVRPKESKGPRPSFLWPFALPHLGHCYTCFLASLSCFPRLS